MGEARQSITVLVVEDGTKNPGETKGALQSLGVYPENIVLTDSADEALDILLERQVKGERERILLLLCDIDVKREGDGASLMELAKGGMENPPYVVAMGRGDRSVAAADISDVFLAKDSPDFYGNLLRKGLVQATGFVSAQAFEGMLREGEKETGAVASQVQVISDPKAENKGSEGGATWFERLGEMDDLRGGDSIPEKARLANQLVAVFDLDGTLAKPFTMGRFVQFLTEPSEKGQDSILRQLLKEKGGQAENNRAAKELAAAFKKFRDAPATYVGGYPQFIKDTNKHFSEMLNGLSAQAIFKLGEEWCRKDAPRQIFSHARPIIRLCQELDIVPTLITGTPAEAVAGFRQVLGISERCHPLELDTDEAGRYSGLKYETGLTKSKNEVMRKIVRNGNHIILSAGDQITDSPLHEAALSREHDSLSGVACYFGSDHKDIQGFSHHLENRWMLPIPYMERTTYAILEMIVERLHAVSQLEENMAVLSVGFREKINELIQERKLIRKFTDSEVK